MMLEALRRRTTHLHAPADRSRTERVAGELGLPASWAKLMCESNGLEVFDGYLRLFGVSPDHGIDLETWNRGSTWRFSWPSAALDDIVFFGGSAWGDQLGFRRGKPGVYWFDALLMEGSVISPSFEAFCETQLVRDATDPADAIVHEARQRLGPIQPDVNLVYVPSLLIGGEEDLGNVLQMPAASAMVANGDIFTQVREARDDAVVEGVEPYEDSAGRTRLRLITRAS